MSTETFRKHGELFKEISEFVAKSCKVIYWRDGRAPSPPSLRGGSCFILRFRGKLVGVTADHVVEIYLRDRAQVPALVCQLWNIAFELSDHIIDRDTNLDIATFEVSEQELSQIGGNAIDCRGLWPPPNPQVGDLISIAGFPELDRQVHPNHTATFQTYIGMTVVDDVNDREIITTYDPNRDHDLSGAAGLSPLGLPPLGKNLSGCSGGPGLLHSIQHGIHRWNAVGLIVSGPGDYSKGETSNFDIIRLRRIHFVKEDGTLDKAEQGWLPHTRRSSMTNDTED